MWEFIVGLDGLPAFTYIPVIGFLFQWISIAISGLAMVWTWDWSSVDDSTIIPESKPTPKANNLSPDDGAALIN